MSVSWFNGGICWFSSYLSDTGDEAIFTLQVILHILFEDCFHRDQHMDRDHKGRNLAASQHFGADNYVGIRVDFTSLPNFDCYTKGTSGYFSTSDYKYYVVIIDPSSLCYSLIWLQLETQQEMMQVELENILWDMKEVEGRFLKAVTDRKVMEIMLLELESEHDKTIAQVEILEREVCIGLA